MNFIQPYLEQTRQTFLAMPMPSRIISVMLVVAIAIGLGLLVRGDGSEPHEYLFGGRGFTEQELDSIEQAFSRANLSNWTRDKVRISIPSASKSEYIAALDNATTLPLSLRTSLEQAQESSSYFESTEMRNSREMHAKELDLGKKVEKFPEVRFASVEYDRGERVGLGRRRSQSASVLVEPEGFEPLPPGKVHAIKDLISGSFADLDINNVSVIDTNDSYTGSLSEEEDLLRRHQEAVERSYVNKVRTLLKDDYGQIRVLAFAEVDPTMDAEKVQLTYDEPMTIADNTRKSSSETNRTLNEGVPGTATNVAQNRPVSIEKNVQVSKESEDQRESKKLAGHQYEQSRLASFQVNRVRMSIALPDSYYPKLWMHRNPGKNPNDPADVDPVAYEDEVAQIKKETADRIKRLVANSLPDTTPGEDKFDQLVEVGEYPDLAEPMIDDSRVAEKALTWLSQSWQTIALVMLGLIALLVARSAAKAGGETSPAEFNEGFGLEIPDPPVAAQPQNDSSESMTITGSSLKDELVELVENNPEVAANVIRGWVGEAA